MVAEVGQNAFAAVHICQLQHRALRMNATTAQVLRVAIEDCGYIPLLEPLARTLQYILPRFQRRAIATVCVPCLQHRALRTNATTAQVLQVAVEDCGYSLRPGEQPGVPQALLQQHQLEASLDVQESSKGTSGSDSSNDGSSHEDNSGGSSSSSLAR
jgi:hypothetical protein